MEAKIVTFDCKLILGKKLEMSLANNLTPILWKSFIPQIPSIPNRITKELISVSVYPQDYFQSFHPSRNFEKWAGVEVSLTNDTLIGLESLRIENGMYAEFLYQGLPKEAGVFYQNIFRNWLPNSKYQLDASPHFEVMGEKYKNEDPNSEELVYIPITLR